MGLWTAMPERLQSPMCSLYKVPLQLIKQGTKGTISALQKPIDAFSRVVPILKSDNTNRSIDQDTEGKNAMKQKTNNGLLTKTPSIRFLG